MTAYYLRRGESGISVQVQDNSPGPEWGGLEKIPTVDECILFDAKSATVVFRNSIPLSSEELTAQQKAAEDAALMKADTIRELQAKVAEWETQGLAALTKIAELESRLAKVEEGKI